MQPILSIVIANYNYGRFLDDAIQSVISQNMGDTVELIICDGGSTDNSVEIIKKYANGLPQNTSLDEWLHKPSNPQTLKPSNPQTLKPSNSQTPISWWCSEKDKGQSNAFNKGFSHAQGRFLTWLNADDVMLPGTLTKLEKAIENHPQCEWFVGGVIWLDPEMRVVNCGRGRPFSEIRYREGNVSVWGPSSFFTKRLLDSVGGVDERFHFTMDSDLWLRFACQSNARYIPFCKYAWGLRLHPDAKMSGHDFLADGKLDVKRTEKERISHSRYSGAIEQERKYREEYYKSKPKSMISRLLSVSWRRVLMARYDLWRWRGRKLEEINLKNNAGRTIKIAFISSHPAPYRDVFLCALANSQALDATIYTEFMKDKWHSFWNLDAQPYPIKLIDSGKESQIKKLLFVAKSFVFGKYDCVCWNGFPPRLHMLLPLFITAIIHNCYGIYADTISERRRGGLSFYIKSFLVRRAAFLFVPGRASMDYFCSSFGFPKERICLGAYALDGKTLEAAIFDLRRKRNEIRSQLGIEQNDSVFLMVANMLPKREYPVTTAAFLKVAEKHHGIRYVIVGIGDDLHAMQKLAIEHKELLVIQGCSFEKMKELYAMADVYVHGGYEPASTALVLGGIAHLPLISSFAVGCSRDVLEDGVSGVLVDRHNSENDWIAAFEKMLHFREFWQRMGDEARRLSMELDVDVTVSRFETLVKRCCS
jgi:glycosyltransferase involved in cell wall biosynthesis